jgi:chitinase
LKKLTLAVLVGASLLAQSAIGAQNNRAISYVTSWGLPTDAATVLDDSKVDTFLLAFGKWNADGTITTSDNIATVPAYNAWYLDGGYNAWTQLKLAHPEKKMMIAFGGQTYEEIWTHIDTPEKRTIIATGLAKLLTTPFPVYKKGLKPADMQGECLQFNWDGKSCDMSTYQRAGTVYLDGIDFDFEKGARLTEKENSDLLALATQLRGMIAKDKLLSLTTYHVGADPENCSSKTVFENCSYVENDRSSHNGEVKSILKGSTGIFDFYNVMAYDAGPNFKYKTAMANYASAVGDTSKIILGTTINQQWGPEANFVESKENNLERARWQAAEGYGGFFAWALGSNTQSMSLANQTAYLDEMKVKADSAVPDENAVVSDITVKAGEINVVMPADKFTSSNVSVRINGKYHASVQRGKVYYSLASQRADGQYLIRLTGTIKAGDVVTVNDDRTGSVLKTLNVTAKMLAVADVSITSVSAVNDKITVTMPEAVFMGPYNIAVKVNGIYAGESYSGTAYYSQKVPVTKGQTGFIVSHKLKKGDVISVEYRAGGAGLVGEVLKVMNTTTIK